MNIFQQIGGALVTGAEDVVKFVEGIESPSTKASGTTLVTTLQSFETQGEAFIESLAVDGANAALALVPMGLGAALVPVADAAIEAIAAKLFAKHSNPAAAAQAVANLLAAPTASTSISTATSAVASLSTSAAVTISITPTQIQSPIIGTSYSQSMSATGGSAPYSWEIASGAFPPGIALSATGVISGTATDTGTYEVTIKAIDANGASGLAQLTFVT